MTDEEVFGAAPGKVMTEEEVFGKKPRPLVQRVANYANEAFAAVPDAVLNTPTNILNLLKAGVGTGAIAMGRPDLAPELSQPPNLVRRGMEAIGGIDPSIQPQSETERRLKPVIQGAASAMFAPASSIPQVISNMGTNAVANVTGDVVTEQTGNQNLGMLASMAAVPVASKGMDAAAGYGARVQQNAQMRKSQNAVKDATLNDAQGAGYVLPPSAVNGTFIGNRLESISGKAAIGQEAAVRNQQTTNKLARQEAGLPDDSPISTSTLGQRRDALAAPYREISAISPRAAQALEDLKDARFDTNAYYRHYDVSADPKSLKKARNAEMKATQLEARIDAEAVAAGRPDLLPRLQDARRGIAKTWEVERSLNLATGDVSAPILGRAFDKGKPLSGGLATAGKFAQAYPSYAREGERIPTPGVSKSEALAGSLLGVGGYAALGPAGAVLAALPLASGPVRQGMLTRPMQNLMVKPDYSQGALLSQMAPSDPLLRSLILSAMQQGQQQ